MIQTPSKVSLNTFCFHLSIRLLQSSFLMNLSVEASVLFRLFLSDSILFPRWNSVPIVSSDYPSFGFRTNQERSSSFNWTIYFSFQKLPSSQNAQLILNERDAIPQSASILPWQCG